MDRATIEDAIFPNCPIRNILAKEDTMTIDEISYEIDKLMAKYRTSIAMLGTEDEFIGVAVLDKNENVILGCMAKAGREIMKIQYKEEIDELINDFNKQEQIGQDKIITLLDTIYSEYPISDILFEIKENNKISLANLEFDY